MIYDPPSNAAYFGRELAVGDDWIAVGSGLDPVAEVTAGHVDVYTYDGVWNGAELAFPGTSDPDLSGFGVSVAIDSDLMVVGACGLEVGTGDGAAYVFRLDSGTWVSVAKLTGAGATSNELFGFDVDVAGRNVVVGAKLMGGDDEGSAFLFAGDLCFHRSQSFELTSYFPEADGHFGGLVAIVDGFGVVTEVPADGSLGSNEFDVSVLTCE